MYLKLSANNERFQVKFLSSSGVEIIPSSAITCILYNKINSNYIPFQTETIQSFQFSNKQITDRTTIYVDVYLDNVPYKTKVKVNVTNSEVLLKYNVNFDSSYSVRNLTNKFLRRVSLGMPRWSTAYKNDISNYSKTFYPLYLLPEKLFYKTYEALNKNLKNKKHSKRITVRQPIAVAKQGLSIIPKTYIKEKEVITSITKTPITQVGLNLVTFDSDSSFPVKLDKTFNTLFIKTDKECFIIIKGIGADRKRVTETLYCDGVLYSASFLNYKEILDISYVVSSGTESVVFTCTNYMSLEKYQNNFRKNYSPSEGVTGTKDLEVPLYIYNSDTLTINTFYNKVWDNEVDYQDSYFVPDMENHKGFFITEEEDLIFLQPTELATESVVNLLSETPLQLLPEGSTTQLFVGLLTTDLSTDMPIHSSNNNNSIVSLLDSNIMEDNLVEFQVLCKDLVEEFGNISVNLSINVDGKMLYLNDNNEWVEDKVFKFLYNKNPIYVSYDTKGIGYVSVVLECNGISYQSSVVKNKIEVKGTSVVVDKLYHNGNSLVGIVGKQLFKLNLEKDYYEFNNDNSISYDNYNSNTTLLNIKGQLDGEYLNGPS